MVDLSQFHFLRPEWLWLLPLALLVWWLMRRQHDTLRGWRQSIAAHLLPFLLVNNSQAEQRVKPVSLLGWFWLLGIVALSGPSWQREASPFAEEQSVLVVVLKMTPDMQAGDVQPSRLLRAVDKIDRLLKRRPDTRTALIAYAGSAHRVMPFTRDHALIVDFARELTPDVMPVEGEDLPRAVELANELIKMDGNPGTLLVLADSVEPLQMDELKSGRNERVAAELWAIAAGTEVIPLPGMPVAPALDKANMKAAANALGGELELISVDDQDVEAINRRLTRNLRDVSDQAGARWRDAGYYLLPLMVLLGLFWFRQGWVVRWSD